MSQEIKDIKQACLDKWRNGSKLDTRLISFDDKFEEWIKQIPENNRETVLTLIQNLEYYSHRTTNYWLKNLHSQLLQKGNITDENTIYVFIKSKYGKSNSSNDYWTEYKSLNCINSNICITDIEDLELEDFKYIENVVFIDDFSGSGKTFLDEIKKNPSIYKGKNIYFITINIMYKAVKAIEEYSETNGLNIILLSALKQEKAFERHLFSNDSDAKREIKEMSLEFKIPEDEAMGFKKSQALIAFYNNTPNNTLGFIRYDTDTYNSIFPRNDNYVPRWLQLKKERMRRNKMNYNSKIKGD